MNKPFILHTDASFDCIGAVLSQNFQVGNQSKEQLLPVAYLSRKLTKGESNPKLYSSYDQEFLAIIHAIKKWRHYLINQSFTIYTDHKPLLYLQSSPNIPTRHAKWLQSIAEYDFIIKYIPGKTNVVADSLSRAHLNNLSATMSVNLDEDFLDRVREGYNHDHYLRNIQQAIDNNKPMRNFIKENNLLYLNTRLRRLCIQYT